MLDEILNAAKHDIEVAQATYQGLGLTATFFSFFQGRSTTFAIVFAISGIVLAFEGKLTMSFVGLVSAVQALVVAHSAKEDWFAARRCVSGQQGGQQ